MDGRHNMIKLGIHNTQKRKPLHGSQLEFSEGGVSRAEQSAPWMRVLNKRGKQ